MSPILLMAHDQYMEKTFEEPKKNRSHHYRATLENKTSFSITKVTKIQGIFFCLLLAKRVQNWKIVKRNKQQKHGFEKKQLWKLYQVNNTDKYFLDWIISLGKYLFPLKLGRTIVFLYSVNPIYFSCYNFSHFTLHTQKWTQLQ